MNIPPPTQPNYLSNTTAMTLSDDESNGVFDVDEELVPVRELKQAGVMEVTFDGLLSTPLRLEEDLKKGCGGMLWPAGMVMAKYLIRQDKELFKDKTMLVSLPWMPRTMVPLK